MINGVQMHKWSSDYMKVICWLMMVLNDFLSDKIKHIELLELIKPNYM